MPAWRYLVYSLDGLGTETLVSSDMGFFDVSFSCPLSGVGVLSASTPIETASFGTTGLSKFRPWGTAIYVEREGSLLGGYLVTDVEADDQSLKINAESFVTFLYGTPFGSSDLTRKTFAETDAWDIARWLVSTVQGYPRSQMNLNVVPASRRGIKLGRAAADTFPRYAHKQQVAEADIPPTGTLISFAKVSDQPNKRSYGYVSRSVIGTQTPTETISRHKTYGSLTWMPGVSTPSASYDVFGYIVSDEPPTDDPVTGEPLQPVLFEQPSDVDLGARWDQLAKDGQFDYYERHYWPSGSAQTPTHELQLQAETTSPVRDDLRFTVGENVTASPLLQHVGDEWFSEVLVVGAGDGRDAIWARRALSTQDRLRRTKAISDRTILSRDAATRIAASELAWGGVVGQIHELTVTDTPLAPFGAWNPGDTIRVVGSGIGWTGDIDLDVRILDTLYSPEAGTARLTVTMARK